MYYNWNKTAIKEAKGALFSNPPKEISVSSYKGVAISDIASIIAGSISSDGNRLAFIGEDIKGSHKLFIKTGDEVRELGTAWKSCHWDEKGTLWFDKKEGEKFSIWKWSPNMPTPTLVISRGLSPSPSPSGKLIAYREIMISEVQLDNLLSGAKGLFVWDVLEKKIIKILDNRFVVSFCWLPHEEKLVAICLPSDKEFEKEIQALGTNLLTLPSPHTMGRIILFDLSSKKEQVLDKGVIARAISPSFLKDGSIVFIKQPQGSMQMGPMARPTPPKTVREVEVWKYNKARDWVPELLWDGEGYYFFAVSEDGNFLLIISPLEQMNERFRIKLVHIPTKSSKEVGDIERVNTVAYSPATKSFFIVTSNSLLLVDLKGRRKDLLTISHK